MTRRPWLVSLALASAVACQGLGLHRGGTPVAPRDAARSVDDARLRAAAQDPTTWITHGGTYAELRYSTLDRITSDNVSQLGLAWSYATATTRGLEATPLVVDGVLYATGSWSVVFALDARTGRELWRYDPEVPRETGRKACCDVVNRGVALYEGRVYVGTLDGRLLALDAASGKKVWEVQTTDPGRPYTITGAPRVVKGRVLIGNGGAELGVRGYLSAYDAKTGSLIWRFYTVPGDPSQPQESGALERALPTWKGGEWWKIGGGGTVWDSMAYDPDLDLLYVGTGNGSPWSRFVRSPGGGDNLYLSSILALRPDSGELVWYYQETPGDTWDFTATQHIVLADLVIGGTPRKVLLHAPKNGFFYVIDRETGRLLSAEKFAPVTWARRIDRKTGRPVEAPGVDYRRHPVVVKPSPYGAHNWQPMSYSPKTGLVYIPAQDVPAAFALDKAFHYRPGTWNTGTDLSTIHGFPPGVASGSLLAWDPVKQRAKWRVRYTAPWNGGTLATAGNLVFQGTSDRRFVAYAADSGKKLWETPVGTAIVAPPVSYELDGEQYVAVLAGWGGAFALTGGEAVAALDPRAGGQVLSFKLGGNAEMPMPPPPAGPQPLEALPPAPKDRTQVARGEVLYARNCVVCHGYGAVGGGVLPDLRHSAPEVHQSFEAIVLGGQRQQNGMPSFAEYLTPEDVQAIHAYVLKKAYDEHAALAAEEKKKARRR